MPRRLLTSGRCRGATSSQNPHPSLLSLWLWTSSLLPWLFPRRTATPVWDPQLPRYSSPLRNCPIRLVSVPASISLFCYHSRCIIHTCSCAYEGCLEQHASKTWSASFASACCSVSPVSTGTLIIIIISRRLFMHTPLRALSYT